MEEPPRRYLSCQLVAVPPYAIPSSISAVLSTSASSGMCLRTGSVEPCNINPDVPPPCPHPTYYTLLEMSIDASLPPNAPIIESSETQPKINGEEDASASSATAPASTSSLEAICEDVHRRVSAFLDRPADSDLTRRVQEQTRISIGVIEKALNDYK